MPGGEAFNQSAWREARQRAIHSKPHYCAECHIWIDVTLPMVDEQGKRNALAIEVDHIIPLARGGAPYELTNLQLTHMRCNRKKGSKMKSDYDGVGVGNPIPVSQSW